MSTPSHLVIIDDDTELTALVSYFSQRFFKVSVFNRYDHDAFWRYTRPPRGFGAARLNVG